MAGKKRLPKDEESVLIEQSATQRKRLRINKQFPERLRIRGRARAKDRPAWKEPSKWLLEQLKQEDDLPEKWATEKQLDDMVSDILAAVYFDIHYVCKLRNSIKWMKTKSELAYYRQQIRAAAALVDRAIAREMLVKVNPCFDSSQTHQAQQESERVSHFIRILSWKMFAMCALAEAFRRALHKEDQFVWESLLHKIYENRFSIDTFAQSRHLDWQGQLLKHTHHPIPAIRRALIPTVDLSQEHFHHYVVQDGHPRKACHLKPQINIADISVFRPKRFTDGKDPTIRDLERDGLCDLCDAAHECNCMLVSLAGCLVELVDYPHKGVGIRSLARFRKGDILAQYVGELQPVDYYGDDVYALTHESKMISKPLAIISAKRYGNWTRFISHSCDPLTIFTRRTIGKRTMTVVEVIRDISPFEEITVDYGRAYWKSRTCLCGEPRCYCKQSTS
ncbi:SET domain protein [Aspergillus clavatus NRRL 1]|uniref:SET domain protein n=1 Tax=Aspergillus clavatus (strain ATCC 1007 / CBS 513.65 / DSM 816 / NCTC 3887 / NRRL 1 / QM 1276 / 107) TaxID=344612 RepID=A1CAL1_ASPCL|nr:SET domain protein [Aspergillus clavatus NRRL 1]EAW12779.1 SET domain protein [Aspergillus clavatus NRRL 1]